MKLEDELYMYDEASYGAVPSRDAATRILADLLNGRAYVHPLIEPGYQQRLQDIIAGRAVDPALFSIRSPNE